MNQGSCPLLVVRVSSHLSKDFTILQPWHKPDVFFLFSGILLKEMMSFSHIQLVFLSVFRGHFEDNACSSPHTKPVEDNYTGNSFQEGLWDFLHNSYTVNQDVWWWQFLEKKKKKTAKTPACIKFFVYYTGLSLEGDCFFLSCEVHQQKVKLKCMKNVPL